MKAIILSAGQGRRLLPLTEDRPKCLLPLDKNTEQGVTVLSWQLSQLEEAGVTDCTIVTGFQSQKVEKHVERYEGSINIQILYNPFYTVADNLSSVWLALPEMGDDFILLNGDTLFTADVARRLIETAPEDITLTIAQKDTFDDDDMKVNLQDGLVKAVSKKLDLSIVNAESIGMMRFRGEGVDRFKQAVDQAIKKDDGLKVFYLSVLNTMASQMSVGSVIAEQNEWCEVDFPVDHKNACEKVAEWSSIKASAQSDIKTRAVS